MQGPRQLPPQQKRPPRDLNVPTAGRPTQAMVRLSSASNIAETQRMPDTLNKTARLRGVIWRRYTLLRSRTFSCKRSTHHMKSGSGQQTPTITECGNGLMGPPLTSPTGCLVSLMEDSTTHSWIAMIQLQDSGGIWSTATATIMCANLPCRYSS